ncbi:MAG: hypothetical protein HC881_03630 [Leptolyngbyaceae cyanobacterium SL_7_1]|nr:hypothetical protein [Leptolyngbyaceae cyanobacterium SL_7_1]
MQTTKDLAAAIGCTPQAINKDVCATIAEMKAQIYHAIAYTPAIAVTEAV